MFNFLDTATGAATTASEAVNTLCGQNSQVLGLVALVGKIIDIFKIAIPIILVVMGLVSLGKAVVSSKDDEVKKATGGLVKKIILAVAIFFVVAIVQLVVGLVSKTDMQSCWSVISSPWDY